MNPEIFRQALADLGLTQVEAARKMGVSPNTIARWLSGSRPFPGYADAMLGAWLELQTCRKVIDWQAEALKRGDKLLLVATGQAIPR